MTIEHTVLDILLYHLTNAVLPHTMQYFFHYPIFFLACQINKKQTLYFITLVKQNHCDFESSICQQRFKSVLQSTSLFHKYFQAHLANSDVFWHKFFGYFATLGFSFLMYFHLQNFLWRRSWKHWLHPQWKTNIYSFIKQQTSECWHYVSWGKLKVMKDDILQWAIAREKEIICRIYPILSYIDSI